MILYNFHRATGKKIKNKVAEERNNKKRNLEIRTSFKTQWKIFVMFNHVTKNFSKFWRPKNRRERTLVVLAKLTIGD